MPTKPLKPCNVPRCPKLTSGTYCEEHTKEIKRTADKQRGNAHQRGYTARWNRYSKWFLKQPGNQICRLRIDHRCKTVASCVDHIQPPSSPSDPLFWDTENHQASCIICNSIKGKQAITGSEWRV